jgi:predicted amidohydrolase
MRRSDQVRVAAVQYQMKRVADFGEFADKVRYFVQTACQDYAVDFVLFPEFLTVQLLSSLPPIPAKDGLRTLAEQFTEPVIELMSGLASEFGVHLIGGTHPMLQDDGSIQNVSLIFLPDGSFREQPKLHITPWEVSAWDVTGGNSLLVLETAKAKIGVLICYDVEFPEAVRALADQGVDILFVPYCTDDRRGHLRVTKCAAARAIENQIYVVTAGVTGHLPGVEAMNMHYAQSAVFSPSDFGFGRDGIEAEADANSEMLVIADLDLTALYHSRRAGAVTPRNDRRPDLFQMICRAELD